MPLRSLDSHIEVDPGICGGKPRIAGRSILVQLIAIWHELSGMSVDEIASEHDLSLSDVHAALAYYHDHREEIDRQIREDRELVEKMMRETPSRLG